MNTALRLHPRPIQYGPAIEWEELPSLADRLSRGDFQPSTRTAWDATMPAVLEPAPEPEPFVERISGLSTRELRDADVFRHFFA
jgi:hypothetical protein